MSEESNKPRGFGARITESVRSFGASAYRAVKKRIEGPRASYEGDGSAIEVQFDLNSGTVWATQQQMAGLFGVDQSVIARHIKKVFADNEVADSEATHAKIASVQIEGGREVSRDLEHYSLDVVVAVGYKVGGAKGVEFRRWATDKLTAYVQDGFVLNEQRLRNDPAAAQSLADRVRAIRFDEKNLYQRVRDCVVAVASDYDGSSEHVRRFFAKMQDKFHFAACEQTAQQILLARADGTKDRMGMNTQLNAKLTLKDAGTAKNYLNETELHLQYLAGEAFFVYVENMIARGRAMTTQQLMDKIDEVFKFNEMPVFPGYVGPYIKPQVDAYVKQQYELFRSRSDQEKYNANRLDRPRT